MAQHSDRIMEETLIVQSNLDRKFYRKLKVDMYKCVANCHENNSTIDKELDNCIEKCSVPLIKTMEIVDSEIDDIQIKFLRCGETCRDGELSKKIRYDDCVSKCSEEYRKQIKNATERIEKKIFN